MGRLLEAAYDYEVRLRGYMYVGDEATKMHIASAAKALTAPDGKNGLLIMGLYGNGKSTLLRAVCRTIGLLNEGLYGDAKKRINMVSAKKLARLGGAKDTEDEFRKYIDESLLAIDDLGEEAAEIVEYGSVRTPLKDLLQERYERGLFTIVTTNLIEARNSDDPAMHQITARYGARVVDRFREEMNIIVFRNESYRGRLTAGRK